MYSLHDLDITGISVKQVLECEIKSQIGEHSTLTLLAYVDGEDVLYELPDCQEIKVTLKGGKESSPLFSGIVTDMQMSEHGQVKVVEVRGKSCSWLMDRTRQSRSFQNTQMTYKELAKEILGGYGAGDIICEGPDQAIGNLFVQYEETDWAFLTRVFSMAGFALTPDCRQEGIKLYAGVPHLAESGLSFHVTGIDKDMESYYFLKANGTDASAMDFTRYQIISEQPVGMFEPVMVQGKNLAVYSCRYVFKGQQMLGVYGLQSPKGLKRVSSYPMHLIGVALMGKVAHVEGTKIQAMLEIDKEHTERAVYWFPFSTISASPDGSGWYCMPEEGDDVRIYFPSKQEKEALALSAVSNYDAAQAGEPDRMGDPNSRYLRTKSGQELALAPDHIKLSCGKKAASVTIDTDGNITVQAQAMVKVEAEESMTLHAEEALNIHVAEQFIAQSLNGGQVIFDSGDIFLRGTQVNFD